MNFWSDQGTHPESELYQKLGDNKYVLTLKENQLTAGCAKGCGSVPHFDRAKQARTNKISHQIRVFRALVKTQKTSNIFPLILKFDFVQIKLR